MPVDKTTPLLSICIPTYNRAQYLRQCLDAIVNQDGFDDRVEIVISDNCSTDDTQTMCLQFQERYGNVRYFRNKENVNDQNFPLSLRRATGKLRKLTNDTLIYGSGAIRLMLKAAEENMDSRPLVYFLNSGQLPSLKAEVNSLEAFVSTVSYYITWIGSMAIWEDDCNELDTFIEKAYTRLAQVPFAYANFEKRGKAVIYDDIIMSGIDPGKKDLTYGLYNVFYVTFLGFLREYAEAGKISSECYEKVRKDLLMGFFCKWVANQKIRTDKYRFSDENLAELVEKEYGDAPYFSEYKKRLRQAINKERVKKLIGR